MTYSRIDKFVREIRATASLADAADKRDIPFIILMGPDLSGKVGVMAVAAVALALRCLRGPIQIVLPPETSMAGTLGDLRHRLAEEAIRSGRRDRLSFVSQAAHGSTPFGVGLEIPHGYFADAAGWVAGVNWKMPSGVPAAAPAAVFAVCAAFAQFFRSAVLDMVGHEAWTFSLQDFTVAPPLPAMDDKNSLDLGQIGLLGAGAIGSGLAFTLMLSGWSADLIVIDRDRYDQPNWETTMLISREDELHRSPKARLLADLIRSSRIHATSLVTDVVATSPILAERRNLLVCAVDNPETRRILDHANVDCLLNGGVGGTVRDAGHVLCSRHGPGDIPLSALYPDRGGRSADRPAGAPAEVQDECSRIAYQGVSMAAPFLGLGCGALLLAACAQRRMGAEIAANYLKLDMLGQQAKLQLESKHRTTPRDVA